MANTNFDGAVVTGASFRDTVARGFTKEQLYATADYLARDLTGVSLRNNDLSGWDFANQNLTDVNFEDSTLVQADFSGAAIVGTDFEDTTALGFTKEQLYSTASYKSHDLRRINLEDNQMAEWNFVGQDMTGADMEQAKLERRGFQWRCSRRGQPSRDKSSTD